MSDPAEVPPAAGSGSSAAKKKKNKKKAAAAAAAPQSNGSGAEHAEDDGAIDVSTPAAAASTAPATSSPSSSSSSSSSPSNVVTAVSTKLSNSSSKPISSSSPSVPAGAGADMLALLQQQIATLTTRAQTGSDKAYKFWSTQPVPSLNEQPTDDGPIETKTVSAISTAPYALPTGFEWSDVDMQSEQESLEVYRLLNENYVEDDDNMFRFDYSQTFLQWALLPPHWSKQFHIGVRMTGGSRKLVGFITGVPQRMRVYNREWPMFEINYLCVHKKLRSKRLAPVLIKEVTRRVNLTNVWQAVYTAGVLLPKPVSSTRYWHRSLQVKKLIDVHFTRLQKNMTLMRTIKLYKVNEQPLIPGIRAMIDADVPQVHQLLSHYLSRFSLAPVFSEEEVRHWLVPRAEVVYSYVVQGAKGRLTDFCSFYNLPSTIIGHPIHHSLKAAYSYYNVATAHSLLELMADALSFAHREGFDVFNALDVMENARFLEKLKFGPGDGQLQYYLYNYRCREMKPEQVGLVLL